MKEATKIALIYIIICSVYILFSDKLVYQLFPSAAEVTHIQSYKGIAFVLASGSIIYLLVRSSFMKIDKANKSLAETVVHHQMLFDKSPLPAFIIRKDNLTYLRVNEAALLKFKRSEEEFLSADIVDFVVGLSREELYEIRDQVNENGYTELDLAGRHSDGDMIYQQVFCQKVVYDGVEAIFCIALDITAIRDPEKVIVDRMLDALEDERRKIAGELHDGIKQYFGLANGMLKTMKVDAGAEKLRCRAVELTEKGIAESRRLSHMITPQASNAFNLGDSLIYLVENFNMLNGIIFKVDVGIKRQYPDDLLLNVYRIVQEASNNIKLHSRAKNAVISVKESETDLIVEVRDDGAGFDTSLMSSSLRSIGLTTMRTRASKFGGFFSLQSEIGKGTTIRVRIPIAENL